uniref:Leucine rich repeats and calponin homology domain containing 2 n=1 Tax=Scleropages formosus TaxID=113540 RepID=A0A8C9T9V1_SCLFO
MAASQGAGEPPSAALHVHFCTGGPQWEAVGPQLQHQPNTARSLERALEDAACSGTLNLSGRKLREYPRSSHDLADTTRADLSKNRFSEIPPEVCLFAPLETLNLYHNCIKGIPEAIINLQMLTYLNISRNLLTILPKYLFDLPLKVLVVSNNKLQSIPEEIGKSRNLMQLDISCNEIQALPPQMGNLHTLRELNVRRNCLHALPEELALLPLVAFDFSCNEVTRIPPIFRKLRHLQLLALDNNPLQSPPAQVCLKGKVHIFKYLTIQACRMDKKTDGLELSSLSKRCLPQPLTGSLEDFYPNKSHGPDSGIGSDTGEKRLSTTEPSDDDTTSLHSQVSETIRDPTRAESYTLSVKQESGKEASSSLLPSSKADSVSEEEQEEDDLKEVTDLRRIATQLLQQEQRNRFVRLTLPLLYILKIIKKKKKKKILSCYAAVELMPKKEKPVTSYKCFIERYNCKRKCPGPSMANPDHVIGADYSCSVTVDISLSYAGPLCFGNSAFSRGTSQGPTGTDPGFTIRRKMEHMREEMEQIQHLRQNLESRLKVVLPEDVGTALMDGVVLCHLANHIRPRSVPSIHVPSPAVPKLSMAKCRKNVESFLEACKKLGVPQDKMCLPHHILEAKGLVRISMTVQALLELPALRPTQLSAM